MDNFNYKKYLQNNPLLKEEKRVGELTWKFMSDDERMDALLSVVKDPDEASEYVELDWKDLPARINPQNMRIFEGEQKVVVRYYDREKEELVVAYRGTDFDKAVEVKNDLLKRFPKDDVRFNYDYRGGNDDKKVDIDLMAFNVSKGLFEEEGPIKNRNLIKLIDSLSSEYGIDDTRRPDGYPPKEGVKQYIVTDKTKNQYLFFQHDRNTDEFTISRMSGFKIDEDEASRAGMRKGRSGHEAGEMTYMTDGNYTPTPISMDELKRIIDHVMGGLDREAKAQADFYSKRGHTSGTIDEGKRLFHYTIPPNEYGMTRMVIKAKDREEADRKIAAEYPDGGYEYKGTGAKFQY